VKLKEKIYNQVKKNKTGEVKSYKEIARLIGNPKSYRVVANILAKNKNPKIPCHRVIKSDYTIGGYMGSYKNSWKKLALLLKEGVIAVMPTDTIYGICGNALKRKVVEKIYRLRKRSPKKPMIILISDLDKLKIFGVKPNKNELRILKKLWPGKVSVILDIREKEKIRRFSYLHRGTKTLAFRLPKPKWLIRILKISGPLVAPSANWENFEPAKSIKEAKKYFGNEVVYADEEILLNRKTKFRKKIRKPSSLIKLVGKKVEIIREGADFEKIKKIIFEKIKK